MRNAGDVKYRVEILQRVEAGVIAKRTFAPEFVQIDISFEDDLARCWNLKIDGFALY